MATDCTTKASTVPSASASSPWFANSTQVSSTSVSSLVVSITAENDVSVGGSLAPVTVTEMFCVVLPPLPSSAVTVTR